jgi:solute carrier family 25 protein 33/36
VLYEKLKAAVLVKKKENMIAASTTAHPPAPLPTTLSNIEYMTLAASAKLIAAVCTYPHEVIRTRLREQRVATLENPHKYTGLLQALRLIFHEEGLAGLYGGMSTHLLRVVPNAAIMFWTYELVVRYLS